MYDAEQDFRDLVRRLSRYLRDNPLASDTAEGISSWWLQTNWVADESAINAALAWLVGVGLVEEVRSPDGRIRYRRVQTDDALLVLGALADGLAEPPLNGSDITDTH